MSGFWPWIYGRNDGNDHSGPLAVEGMVVGGEKVTYDAGAVEEEAEKHDAMLTGVMGA